MPDTNNNFRHVLCIASIFCFRMLGLFMLLPIFSIYADELKYATHSLMGIGIGIYGLAQAIFQIPLGHLSDKIGRKKVILLGLSLFAIGSIICGSANDIYTLIFGRAIQGAGAIGSALIALIADLTPAQTRTKSMALLGSMIGISFAISIVLGPLISRVYGFHAIFHFMTCLAVLGMLMTVLVLPEPKSTYHPDVTPSRKLFKSVLRDSKLNYLNFSIFLQHFIFTAVFYVVPIMLENLIQIQWHFYLPIMIGSFILAVPLIVIGEKKKKFTQIFMTCIALILCALVGLFFSQSQLLAIGILLFAYFTGFNALEACLPSSVTKLVDVNAKGTAMGVYSTCQFLGIFFGGSLAGHLYHVYGLNGVLILLSTLSVIWLIKTKISLNNQLFIDNKSASVVPLASVKLEHS